MTHTIIRYYDWEGDACRVIEDTTTGDLLAELYRGGIGYIPTNYADILYSARPISEDEHKELVLLEISLSKAHRDH